MSVTNRIRARDLEIEIADAVFFQVACRSYCHGHRVFSRPKGIQDTEKNLTKSLKYSIF